VYTDISYYYSWYHDFIGHLIGFQEIPTRKGSFQAYRISANSNSVVTTQGISAGLNYYFTKKYAISGNYTFSELVKRDESDPLIPNYNTPKNKYNIGFSGRDLNKFGFNVIYKFVEGFDYTGSPQFTGHIPSYDLLDAQVNYKWTAWNTTFKLGVSNLLNNVHYEAYGAPYVGRFGYVSVNYEM
jgi:iron complex outermembrane recepter protein